MHRGRVKEGAGVAAVQGPQSETGPRLQLSSKCSVIFLKKDEALSKRRDKNENAQEQGVSQGETFLNAADEFLEFVTRLDRIIIINCLGSLHPAR